MGRVLRQFFVRQLTRRLTPGMLALVGLVLVTTATGEAARASTGGVDRFGFTATADTYVDSAQPTRGFGTTNSFSVDARPTKTSLLRFEVTNIAGRTVTDVRLRLYQTDASAVGGTVSSVSTSAWDEKTTWDTRPSFDGAPLATFGTVQKQTWYEVSLGPIVSQDGPVGLAIDSRSSDGAAWASRESSTQPKLIVDVEPVPDLVLDGTSTVADNMSGSSDPTYYPSNHRLALTAGGRLLAVSGRHAQGVQLSWRDPAGGWQTDTTGAVSDGLLLGATKTGDWTASIAVAADQNGEEHAWVVWGRPAVSSTASKIGPVQMRRLDHLDAPGGPSVGPIVTVDAPSLGAVRPDIGFERAADGSSRGVLAWLRRTGDASYELTTAWFTDLATDAPAFHDHAVVLAGSSSGPTATLEPGLNGMRLVGRVSGVRMWTHRASDPLTAWSRGAIGASMSSSARPSAAVLDSGETLVATESDTTNDVVTVQRFSATGSSTAVDVRLTGYREPTLTTDGADAWLLMVRASDGDLVSRRFTPLLGWDVFDRVEIAAGAGDAFAHPNVIRRADGRLRLVLRGSVGVAGVRHSVLAYQRPL